jgi:hypothetical protein
VKRGIAWADRMIFTEQYLRSAQAVGYIIFLVLIAVTTILLFVFESLLARGSFSTKHAAKIRLVTGVLGIYSLFAAAAVSLYLVGALASVNLTILFTEQFGTPREKMCIIVTIGDVFLHIANSCLISFIFW